MTAPTASGATSRASPPDLAPTPPQKPLPFDCCESGCERCVYDIYADELAHYPIALAQWQARNPGRDPRPG